jgi:AAA domain
VIENIEKGRGVTGAMRYVMGQGNDPLTGERLNLGEGEKTRAEILGGQNFGFEIETAHDYELARRAMEWNAKPENQWSRARKCEIDCEHISLSWRIGDTPDRAEMIEAAHSCLKNHGMENAMAVFVAIHIVASRIDPDTGKTYSQKDDYIASKKWEAKWERDHGQQRDPSAGKNLHGLIDAVNRRDADALIALVTRDKATFTQLEVIRAISYGDLSKDEQVKFRNEVLGRQNVIGLRETAQAPVTRYTTRDILAAEMALQRDAGALAADERHGVKASRVEKAVAKFTLKPEQAEALRHLAGAQGFAVLYGEAGTGKSHTLKAVRAVYEGEGKDVIGLAFTNSVVKSMRGDGFTEVNTIASEMLALEKGRTSWSAKTVIVVDREAHSCGRRQAAFEHRAGRDVRDAAAEPRRGDPQGRAAH